MDKEKQNALPLPLLRALGEFRYQLRSFLHFSEQVAQAQHLRPRQHQLLLQIAGIRDDRQATINYLAERLCVRQNTVVELADRSVAEGLIRRAEDPADRRRVILSLTSKGMRVLAMLSDSHAQELDELGPRLIRALEVINRERLGKSARSSRARSTNGASVTGRAR